MSTHTSVLCLRWMANSSITFQAYGSDSLIHCKKSLGPISPACACSRSAGGTSHELRNEVKAELAKSQKMCLPKRKETEKYFLTRRDQCYSLGFCCKSCLISPSRRAISSLVAIVAISSLVAMRLSRLPCSSKNLE